MNFFESSITKLLCQRTSPSHRFCGVLTSQSIVPNCDDLNASLEKVSLDGSKVDYPDDFSGFYIPAVNISYVLLLQFIIVERPIFIFQSKIVSCLLHMNHLNSCKYFIADFVLSGFVSCNQRFWKERGRRSKPVGRFLRQLRWRLHRQNRRRTRQHRRKNQERS